MYARLEIVVVFLHVLSIGLILIAALTIIRRLLLI